MLSKWITSSAIKAMQVGPKKHITGRLLMLAAEIRCSSTTFLAKEIEEWNAANHHRSSHNKIEGGGDGIGIAAATPVEIRQTSNSGWGLFAKRLVPKGVLIMRGKALSVSRERGDHSIQTGWESHALMDLPAVLINHKCNSANTGIRGPNNFGAYGFYSLRAIDKDEEFLWDYETAEYEMDSFTCSCGDPNCRGKLKGFRANGTEVLERYGKNFIATYLLEEGKDANNDEIDGSIEKRIA